MTSRTLSPSTRSAYVTPALVFAESELGRKLLEQQVGGTASSSVLAEFILRNPVRIVAWGIEELAQNSGVSAPTISRFSRLLGFAGYHDLRSCIADTMQSALQPVEKLRGIFERSAGATQPVTEGLETTLANLRAAAEGLAPQTLAAVVKRLQDAPTVYLMGFGLSAHLSGYLALHLEPFCAHLVNVVEFGGTEVAASRLRNITNKDLLLVISLPRYSIDVMHLTDYARDRGACIVGITDSPASPLAQRAEHLLIAQSTHPVLTSSGATTILIIEALVTSLMVSKHDSVMKVAELTESISTYIYRTDNQRRRK